MKRLQLAQITPLEIWDAPVRGRALFDWQDTPELPAALLAVARDLHARHGFAHLHLLGGGALREDVLPALRALEIGVTRAADPRFAAARAGSALIHGAACADVGQTSLKLAQGDTATLIPRDLLRAPIRIGSTGNGWQSTRAFLCESLQPAPRLLALPCTVDAAGALGDCSYCFDIDSFADLAGDTLLVNDAELAAVAAARDPAVPPAGVTLVLTLGFGVGAALLSR